MTLHLGYTENIICPVTTVLGFSAIRPTSPGPLFLFEDNLALSQPKLVQALCQPVHAAGVDDSQFSEHSFQIGKATMAVRVGKWIPWTNNATLDS